MTNPDLALLASIAYVFAALAVIGVGFLIGEIVFAIVRAKKKERRPQGKEFIISKEKLDTTTKDMDDYKTAANMLGDWLKKIQEIKDNGGDTNAKP